jgi:alpha-tubulin suppressor-like RCC1 family protein
MFGDNSFGELGIGDDTPRFSPQLLPYLFEKVSCGSFHTGAVTSDGKLFTWGDNEFGQLGTEDTNVRYIPTEIEIASEVVADVACGAEHTVILTVDGKVFTCGNAIISSIENEESYRLGLPYAIIRGRPIIDYPERVPLGISIVAISCGDHHTGAIAVDGRLFMWGNNLFGQMGLTEEEKMSLKKNPDLPIWTMRKYHLKSISCGDYHTGVITDNGKLFLYGNNDNQQLGLVGEATYLPTEIKSKDPIIEVACGRACTAYINNKNDLFLAGFIGYRRYTRFTQYPLIDHAFKVSCGSEYLGVIVGKRKGKLPISLFLQ